MIRNRKAGKARCLAAASILTLALVALPFEPSLDGAAIDGTAAHAKGNGGGGGNGGGNGGGHGGGNSGHGGTDSGTDGDGDDTASTAGSGKGHGKAGAPGQNKHGASGFAASGDLEEVGTKKHGATASMMGGLSSWTHASANARLNASANSQVGLAASYEKSILNGEIGSAIESLLAAANKPVTDEIQALAVVESINAALDISVDGTPEDLEVTETLEDLEVTETLEDLDVTETPEDPEVTETPEDPEVTEVTETVQSRTISRETMDAVVDGFLAGDSTLGETGGDDTADGEETTTAEGDDPDTDGGTDDGTVTTPSS
ncbi:MAG: hypothetical protein ACTSQ7_09665 [Alphaproteobacteria bacterium]